MSVLGIEYSNGSENMEAVRESVVPEEGGSKASGGSGSDDFFRDDSIGLYYAGDMMVSSTTSDAGVEIGVGSAAMSAWPGWSSDAGPTRRNLLAHSRIGIQGMRPPAFNLTGGSRLCWPSARRLADCRSP